MKNYLKYMCFAGIGLALSGCSGFFDKDNTPTPNALNSFTPEVRPHALWSTKTGSGSGSDYLKLQPALSDQFIFTVDKEGNVNAIDKQTGKMKWDMATHMPAAGGPGVGDNLVVVAGRKGDVYALNEANGSLAWNVNLSKEILSTPAISRGVVLIKASDGYVYGLSAKDGHTLWSNHQVEPVLILRASSSPQVLGGESVMGFANGNIVKMSVAEGSVAWVQPITIPQGAFAVQRMIDIDANPLIFKHHIYAATYQGKIASLDWQGGSIVWSQDLSSYTGLTADDDQVYVTDAASNVWAFDTLNGGNKWQQNQLLNRNITGPALMNNYVVVGDSEGYLHWLSQKDGHFAGRVKVGRSAMVVAPVVENNILYAVSTNGYLTAYTLN